MDVLFRRKRDVAFVAAGLVGFSSAAYGWYLASICLPAFDCCHVFIRYTYLTHYCKKPRLYVADGRLKEMLERGVPNLFLPYRPSPWLLNSHLMTVAGGRISPSVRLQIPMLIFSTASNGKRLLRATVGNDVRWRDRWIGLVRR